MSGRAAQRSDLQAEIAALRQRLSAAEKALREARSSKDTPVEISEIAASPELLALLPQGVACLDADGTITFANDRLGEIVQQAAADIIGSRLENYLTFASRVQWGEVIAGRSDEAIHVEAAIQSSDGRRVPVYISLRSYVGKTDPKAVVVVTDLSEHESRRRTDEYVDRISRLQSVTAALSEAMTMAQVADVMLHQVVSAVGASAGTLHLVADEQLHLQLYRWSGYAADVVLSNVRLPIDGELPMCDAAANREPVFLPSAAARSEHYPQIAFLRAIGGDGAFATLPLLLQGRVLGCLSINYPSSRQFTSDERTFLLTVAHQCAQALDRARLYDAERVSRQRAEQEIAERKRVEQELRVSQSYVRRLVESDIIGILFADEFGNISQANDAFLDMIGFSRAELDRGCVRWTELTPTEYLATDRRAIREAQQRGSCTPYEKEYICKDGARVPILIGFARMEHDATSFVCFILDQTARKRLERELLARNEQLAQADRIKNEFLANISHELRTPMNAILGMTELALAEDLPPTARDYLQTANASAGVLLGLLNDILDLSKLEAGKFSLESSRFSLREMLDETIKSLAIRAYEKGLELSCHVAVDVPDAVNADALRLRQVLINLVGNAIKFTEQGEIVVRVGLESRTSSEVSLRFEVTDTGIGISHQDQQRIFAPFTQADASMTRHYGGTGLGLAISAELIGMMGGQIWVSSQLGQGSTFYFTARVGIELEPESSSAVCDVLEQLRGIRVLVVDDNESNRQIIDELLRHWGMTPELCPDGPTALAKIHAAATQGQPYPLVILDALMPGMDGFTLASWIKGDPQLAGATVLMMSSAERHVYSKRLDDLRVAAHFEKPITQADLFGAVLRALGIKQPAPSHIQPIQLDRVADEASLDVLLAEDTLANEKVIVTILERRGHRVQVARNGNEAIELAREQVFDVVLMDIQMPIMDGFQATAALRARQTGGPRRLPIIAMTAHAMRGDRERCLAAGMDAYIAKPIDIHRLIELVESFGPEPAEACISAIPTAAVTTEQGDIVDIPAAMKRLGGDANLLREIIQLFFEDSPDLLSRVRESAASGKAREAERAAHSLRGLTSNFDARRAAAAASDIESLASAGRLKEIPELIPKLENELQLLRVELQNYLQQLSA